MDCTDISWLSSLTDLLEGYTVRAEESGMTHLISRAKVNDAHPACPVPS